MKKILITMLFLAIPVAILADNLMEYKKLKAIGAYKSSEYNLSSTIKYMEVRLYNIQTIRGQKKFISPNYKTITAIKSSNISNELIAKIKKYPPIFTYLSNIHSSGMCVMSGCGHNKGNAFIVDTHNKVWKMDEVSDVLNYLGDIDTEAELRLLLWLKSIKYENSKYRKIKDGYEVIVEYDNDLSNIGECGHFKYHLIVTKQGDISQLLLSKSKSKNGCLALD